MADDLLAQAHQAHQAGNAPTARRAYRAAIAAEPEFFAPYGSFGSLLDQSGDLAMAEHLLKRARRLEPRQPMLSLQLALLAQRRGDLAVAADRYRYAAALEPAFLDAWFNLAGVCLSQGALTAGFQGARRAVTLAPALALARYNLGDACLARGRLAEAASELGAALALDPAHAGAVGDWANLQAAMGDYAASERWHDRVLAHDPANNIAWSNRLFAAMADPDRSDGDIKRLGEVWAQRFPKVARTHHAPGPKLRIGYVSPDFRDHACAQFLEPVFRHHDRDQVEVVAYAETRGSDAVTERFRHLATRWRATEALDDHALADMIRSDGIDVLVDLAGHSGGNRLGAVALRAAPVAVGWLGFNASTGLSAIDWRLCDPWIAPPGFEANFSEALWRLDRVCHCWEPPADAPTPGPLGTAPTFGSFNNLSKLSPATTALWARVLSAVPESRLMLKAPSSGERATQRRVLAQFAGAGISSDRIAFAPWAESRADHLASYGAVDVALDPLPYNGTTTTCEALWMGVPVVTLPGRRMIGRIGSSLLSAIGLSEGIAVNAEDYVARARQLIRDRSALQQLRASLRARIAASPLCDGVGFTRGLERAFRAMRSAV